MGPDELHTSSFAYEFNDRVVISESDEEGQVIGRADFSNCENQYLVRYKAGDGRAVEGWWGQSALARA